MYEVLGMYRLSSWALDSADLCMLDWYPDRLEMGYRGTPPKLKSPVNWKEFEREGIAVGLVEKLATDYNEPMDTLISRMPHSRADHLLLSEEWRSRSPEDRLR